MGFLNSIANVATLGMVPDITGEDAAQAAADAGIAANNASIAETSRQFDLTREDLLPFLEAGTGALSQYQGDIGGAPGAPKLGQFSFDPNQALNNPALTFQREYGEQQLDRLAGKNRQLNSGNRLYDVVKFGQGLAANSLNDEYNRQHGIYSTNQNTDLKNYSLASDRYNNRMNRLAGLIDVGRGTGSALGQLGAQSSGNIASLLQNTGQLQGAAALAEQQGTANLLNLGVGALGAFYGGPAGAAAAGGVPRPAVAPSYNYSPVPQQGFF